MTAGIVAGVLAAVVVLVIVTRNSSRVKREAREDLRREQEALPARDIMDLVREEVEETGVDQIPGGEGVEIVVRLQVYHRDEAARAACPDPASLRFVVTGGVSPEQATAADVRLHFEGYVPDESEDGDDPAPV